MEVFETKSVAGTTALGKKFAARLGVGDCVALVGELGAGKTALVRGIALGLCIERVNLVSSPTFVLVQEYPGRVRMFHIDLYRMAAPHAELAQLGVSEMLREGVVLIEWADRATGGLPRPRWEILIEHIGLRSRRFTVSRVE